MCLDYTLYVLNFFIIETWLLSNEQLSTIGIINFYMAIWYYIFCKAQLSRLRHRKWEVGCVAPIVESFIKYLLRFFFLFALNKPTFGSMQLTVRSMTAWNQFSTLCSPNSVIKVFLLNDMVDMVKYSRVKSPHWI